MAAPTNTYAPTIAGTPAPGHTLRCFQGVWTNDGSPTFTYQWQRAGSNISSATSDTYTLVSADDTNAITCNVTCTDSGGSTTQASDSVTCGATQTVTWTPANRQSWEPDTLFLFDPDIEAKFWDPDLGPAGGGLLDYTGMNHVEGPDPWTNGKYTITSGKYRRGITGRSTDLGSLWFPGISVPSSSFTVEFWTKCSVNWASQTAQLPVFFSIGTTDNPIGTLPTTAGFVVGFGSGKASLTVWNSQIPGTSVSAATVNGSTGFLAGAFVNYAVTFNGSTITLYENSTSKGTVTTAAPYVWSGSDRNSGMGMLGDSHHPTDTWVMSDLRISRTCRVPATAVSVSSASVIDFS